MNFGSLLQGRAIIYEADPGLRCAKTRQCVDSIEPVPDSTK